MIKVGFWSVDCACLAGNVQDSSINVTDIRIIIDNSPHIVCNTVK